MYKHHIVTTAELTTKIQDAPKRAIAARIRDARHTADLTLDALAGKVGTSRHHLIRLEKADHRPRARMLAAIADATGQPLDFFVSSEGDTDDAPFRDAA